MTSNVRPRSPSEDTRITRPDPGAAAVEPGLRVQVRDLRTADDYAACVRLQHETWGRDFAEYVPALLLKVGQMVGGVSAGAFTPQGRLVGFVFGLTGTRDGERIHWSHMLAVRPEYRDRGVGRRLKEHQREVLLDQGIERIYWTFDPLVARNAQLNLNRLGVEVLEYVPDMYGETGSPLHAFGTDRLVVVAGPVGSTEVAADGAAGWRQAPVVEAAGQVVHDEAASQSEPGHADGDDGPPLVRIEVPTDVHAMPVEEARGWRGATRSAFLRLLGSGYRVIGFYTDDRRRSFYVLARRRATRSGSDRMNPGTP